MTKPPRTSPKPSRRRFLVGSALFSSLAVVGWQVWGRLPDRDVADTPSKALTSWQYRTLVAACAAALDDERAGALAAADLDSFLSGAGKDQAADMALALAVLEFVPGGLVSTTRFSRLPPEEAAAVLVDWGRSSLAIRRQIAKAMREAARMTWFSRDETWDALGYDGPWIGRTGDPAAGSNP